MYDMSDFMEKMKKSRKNMSVQRITHKNMILFQDQLSKKFPKDFNIMALKIVEFRRGSTSIFAKNSYVTEDFKEMKVMKKTCLKLDDDNIDFISEIPKEENCRGVSEIKKKGIVGIVQINAFNATSVFRRPFCKRKRL